jgi:hypothetical protein
MLIQVNALAAGAWEAGLGLGRDANRNLLASIQTVRHSIVCAGGFDAGLIVTPRAYGFVSHAM